MLTPTITIPQDRETVASRDIAPGPIAFTYIYARSRDSRNANTSGQDFIAYRYDADRIAFAVCDGVSQSFYGEIAARFLGLRLVDFLWDVQLTNSFLPSLDDALKNWTGEASALVAAKSIRPELPEMQKVALERKRENGSESMFVAGVVDRRADQIGLCWMGDMRLWLWGEHGRAIDLPDAVWETRERWSSRVGPKNGSARGCLMPLTGVTRITAHSDGVGRYGVQFSELSQDLLNSMVDELGKAAASDDVSVFDIDLAVRPLYGQFNTLGTPVLQVGSDAEPVLIWKPVPFASRYRVLIDNGRSPYTEDVEKTSYFPPHESDSPLTCAVQALNDYAFPGAWSDPVVIEAGRLTAPLVVAAEPAPTQPKKARQKKRSRVRHALIMLVSALLLIVIVVAVWIAVVIVGWNNLVEIVP